MMRYEALKVLNIATVLNNRKTRIHLLGLKLLCR